VHELQKETLQLKELKSNTRLTLFLALALLPWLGAFGYGMAKTAENGAFYVFLLFFLLFLNTAYAIWRLGAIFLESLMEIRRLELYDAIEEAKERWGQ
jgi:cation transporter-like permease